MFEEYIGRRLKPRYKYIGLKYARKHGYPELISSSSYGICFKDGYNNVGERNYLVFRVFFDSKPVYINGKRVPGKAVKTVTEVVLFGEGYSSQEMEAAERITREYLELALELTETREKQKRLDRALDDIRNRYGKGSIVRAGIGEFRADRR